MVEKLTAKQALANCDKPSAQCSSDQRNELTQTINKLDATDLLRDAELQLTCNQGSVAKCMQFVDASYEALKSYKNAELAAQSQGLSPEDYIASMGGKDAATAFIDEYKSIIKVHDEAYGSISERDPVQWFGEGEDRFSRRLASGVEKTIEVSMANYPEATTAILGVLENVSDTIDVVVTYTDDATGNIVSAQWNSLDQELRSQLKGVGKIASFAIPITKIKPILGIAKVAKAGKVGQVVANTVSSKGVGVADGSYLHHYQYADRVRARGVQDPVSHNFPYTFDDAILATNPIPKPNNYTIYRKLGTMNERTGVFEIGVTKDGVIDHRFFRPDK